MKKIVASKGSGSVAFIGLGNADRADDGFGLDLAGRLKDRWPGLVFSEEERAVEGIVFDLIERSDVEGVVFVDAVNFGGEPGELHLFGSGDAERIEPSFSTHKVPITLLMGLLVEKEKEPFLLGVQPGSLELMGSMTPHVQRSLDTLEQAIVSAF